MGFLKGGVEKHDPVLMIDFWLKIVTNLRKELTEDFPLNIIMVEICMNEVHQYGKNA